MKNAQPSAMHVNRFTAAKVLALGAVGVLLYVAHAAFIPVALALLFALILSGPVEALHRLRVPRGLSAAVILIVVLVAMGGAVDLMWGPAQQWFKSAPQTVRVVKRKLAPAAKFLGHIEALRETASVIGAAVPATAVAADKDSAPVLLWDATREAAVSTVTFIIITLFLLAGGPPMLARMTAAFVDDLNVTHVIDIIEKVRGEVGRFYVTTALINIGLGCATAGTMMLCGMPTPYLWGTLAGILNFVPYAGSAMTLVILTSVALVTFDSIGQALLVPACYLALATLEGQLIQPLFVGRRLAVNPLLIFLALWFGGLFWGIAGVILATPALVALKVVAENASGGKAVLEFLGPNDQRPERKRPLRRLLRPVRE
ncbi:MAG: AI-2E family transporter [Pseudomonadota bacterium]|nr:AI-2E family transporter [Pseudomonadota bacterium]